MTLSFINFFSCNNLYDSLRLRVIDFTWTRKKYVSSTPIKTRRALQKIATFIVNTDMSCQMDRKEVLDIHGGMISLFVST